MVFLAKIKLNRVEISIYNDLINSNFINHVFVSINHELKNMMIGKTKSKN